MAGTTDAPTVSPSPVTVTERPSMTMRSATAPGHTAMNGHMVGIKSNGHADFSHGVQVIDEDKEFK